MSDKKVIVEVEIVRLRFVKEVDHIDYDLSWLDQTDEEMGTGFEAKAKKRKEAYNNGDWHMVGVYVEALTADGWVAMRSGGLWNIESDSSDEYFEEVAGDQRVELADDLRVNVDLLNELPSGWVDR